MTQQYSSRDFFRRMPNALLARYFHSKGLFSDLDFMAMRETKPDALHEAWDALTDAQRRPLEADFRDVLELSNPKGFAALRDEAAWHLDAAPGELATLLAQLAALEDDGARAMTVFLDRPEFWRGACRFHHADRLSSYWRKRRNLPHKPAKTDEASLVRLAELLKGYFSRKEGRGRNCVVEAYRRDDKDYFFAFPEDHAQRSIEWVNGAFDPRPHNPAFEVIFVYTQAAGRLDINFKGDNKTVAALQEMFADAVLGLNELPPDPKDDRVYELNMLMRPDFEFVHPVGSGVGAVVVRKLRLTSRIRKGDRITLEADGKANRLAIYDLLAQLGKALPLNLYSVTQAELSAAVWVAAGVEPKTVTFRVSWPNSCSLKYDTMDLQLREMLEASGIEPKAPAPAGAVPAQPV